MADCPSVSAARHTEAAEPKGCDWCGRRHLKVPERCARKNRAYDQSLYKDWKESSSPNTVNACCQRRRDGSDGGHSPGCSWANSEKTCPDPESHEKGDLLLECDDKEAKG